MAEEINFRVLNLMLLPKENRWMCLFFRNIKSINPIIPQDHHRIFFFAKKLPLGLQQLVPLLGHLCTLFTPKRHSSTLWVHILLF